MQNAQTLDGDLNLVRRSLREAYKHIALALEKSSKAKDCDCTREPSCSNLALRLKMLETTLIEEIEVLELAYSMRG